MSTILIKSKSLFYQGLDAKNGNVMLNKRNIVSAVMKGQLDAEITMSSGEVFHLNMNASQFGELIFLLLEVGHMIEPEAKP